MNLKPSKTNLVVTLTPEELLDTDAYLLMEKELFRANKIKNIIAQSIWGRLLDKMPEKTKRHDLFAISVIWLSEKNEFEVTFWNEEPTKDTVLA